MRHTFGEVETGKDVWMIRRDVHGTKPILVTVGEHVYDPDFMMPKKSITIHDREGMVGSNKDEVIASLIKACHSIVFDCEHCYDTEEEAQVELDKVIENEERYDSLVMEEFEKICDRYISSIGNGWINDKEDYRRGFVDAATFFKRYPSMLDVTVSTPGCQAFKKFDNWPL